MKKIKKKNNIGTIIIILIIILLVVFFAYKLNNDIKDNNIDNNNKEINENEEKISLEETINNIKNPLSIITIVTAIDKYNAGGDYITKKQVNLLEDTSLKQLFIMEQIINNNSNNSNFIILDSNGNLSNEELEPNTDGILAYYPTSLFKEEYNKYFIDSFDYKKRKVSSANNKYDSNDEYIYYNNRRSGMNGLYIEEIKINSIKRLSKTNDEYEASITLTYNNKLSELLNVKEETAKITYIKDNTNNKLSSYILD